MRYNEQTKKVLDQQLTACPDADDLSAIINTETCLTAIALRAYHLGVINGKQEERAKKSRGNDRQGISKELADFMRLFNKITHGAIANMTVRDLYEFKNEYGLSDELVRVIFSL